jgi:cobalt-precorrin-5B (C1)-methyltransferase
MLREQRLMEEAEIILPTGDAARFRLHGQEFTENFAACFVVKDAGDDPDVTNGAEIHARISIVNCVGAQHPASSAEAKAAASAEEAGCCAPASIIIEGGVGVGRVTKPGLAVPVGEWAINPVPRRMIEEAVREVFTFHRASSAIAAQAAAAGSPFTVCCSLSIPNGEELAKKTLNARLGILGGLSILGTTGIVKPISAKAWTDTIDAAIDVARACGCETVVLATGRTSEMAAQRHLGLTEESYVMMVDHVGYAVRACAAKGVPEVIIAGQFAKLLKIACGHEQTHVSSSELDLEALAGWLDCDPSLARLVPMVRAANTARQILDEAGHDPQLIGLVCDRLKAFTHKLAPRPVIKVFLAGYGGEVLYCA